MGNYLIFCHSYKKKKKKKKKRIEGLFTKPVNLVTFFFFEGLYFQENFIWKTSILKNQYYELPALLSEEPQLLNFFKFIWLFFH